MSDALYLFISVAVMALVTYLVRMLPLSLFRKKIKSRFVLDFLYYVPYAVLAAMTIPAIFYSSNSVISAAAGFLVAAVLAFFERGLLTVAVCACAGVFLTELAMRFLG
ncbi:MAG: AzlD domain-containing protein [Lachnospiraceae bacterium]|nr:AzlD domain-containing protein [Ruminococcus sp.]MCM1273872.1 AzlD domain-containing protein [Lachnospiraceae bacterium]